MSSETTSEKLIKKIRNLEDESNEEKSSGFMKYMGKTILVLVAAIPSLFLFIEYFQIDIGFIGLAGFGLILLVAISAISFLLLCWNYISYGLRGLWHDRIGLIILILFLSCIGFSIFGIEDFMVSVLTFVAAGVTPFILLTLFSFGISSFKDNLLNKELKMLESKFFEGVL